MIWKGDGGTKHGNINPFHLVEHTDEATKQMLENVRKRKIKFDTVKRWHYLAIYSMLLFDFSFLVILYYDCQTIFLFFFRNVF